MKIDMLVNDITSVGAPPLPTTSPPGPPPTSPPGGSEPTSPSSSTTTTTTEGSSTSTTTEPMRRSVGREKRAQGYVGGQELACAKYVGSPKNKPDLQLDINCCTTLSTDAKVVDNINKCNNAQKMDIKISGVDFSAYECYIVPPVSIINLPPESTAPPENPEGSGGAIVRTSFGLLLGAIGLFGCHRIQGVQPAL